MNSANENFEQLPIQETSATDQSYFFDRQNGVKGFRDDLNKWHGVISFYDPLNKMRLYKTSEFSHGVIHGDTKYFSMVYEHTSLPGEVRDMKLQLESLFRYAEGRLIYTELYEGEILRELAYESGMKGGLYQKFYPNGSVMEEGYLQDGVLTGTLTRFDEKNKILSEVEFKNGVKDGVESQYSDGIMKIQVHWKGGLKHGKEIEYGKTELFSCSDEIEITDRLQEIRTERNYHEGILSGSYLEIVKGFVLVKGTYSNNLRNGSWEYYDGDHRLVRNETFQDDILHGAIMRSTDENEFVIGKMVMGRKEGQFDSINSKTLRPITSEIYKNGTPTFFIVYGKDGFPSEIGHIRNSQRDGLAIRVAGDGSRTQVIYKDGVEQSIQPDVNTEIGMVKDIEAEISNKITRSFL